MAGRKQSKSDRQRYTARRAERTASTADKAGTRWTIVDARTALNTGLTVTEAALKIGRTATAVQVLRAKWREGRLPAGLVDQVPPPPGPPRLVPGKDSRA